MAERDPLRYFRIEARDLLDQLGQGVLDLEKGVRETDLVAKLLRLAHTLKGAARVVRQRRIADLAHRFEDLLSPWRETAGDVPRSGVDALLALVDELGQEASGLVGPPAADEPPATDLPAPDPVARPARADPGEIDALLEGIAEVHGRLAGLRSGANEVAQLRRLADLVCAQLAPRRGRGAASPAEGGGGSRASGLAEELRARLVRVERGFGEALDGGDRELRELRAAAERLRLVPAGSSFTALERTCRDAAQALGRQAVFAGLGGEIRLAPQLLAALQPALVQLVRNAVAHGVEPEAVRVAAGKPAAGRVEVAVVRRGSRVVIRCRDDGRGVDLEAVRSAAQRKAPLSPDLVRLPAEELLGLLMRGGLSTAETVTAVAGRGIGLDVVREAVDRLGGEVRVETVAGTGTMVELSLPSSMAAIEVLLVEACERTASLPLASVRGALRLAAGDVVRTADGESVVQAGDSIPFLSLAGALGAPDGGRDARRTAILVEGAGGRAALGVERLVGTSTVALRPLPHLAPAAAVVAGVSLDGRGDPLLALDPDGIVLEARRARRLQDPPAAPAVSVLVVDDSLTTRMLEQSILESAGYSVRLVASGEEALEAARRERFALFLVDVEMPGMDGFSLIERIRADAQLRETPAILVTSRAAPEDRRRGMEAGAQGYIVKSEFDQADLLGQIRRLVG